MSPDPYSRNVPPVRSNTLSKLIFGGVVLLVVLIIASCSVTYIEPSHVGVVIHKTGGGVDKVPLGPGFHGRNPLATLIVEYPVMMQTVVLTKSSAEGSPNNDEINVNSREGQIISLDVSMSFE